MITYKQLVDVINKNDNSQVSRSLSVYEQRGEHDGTIESAIECLKQAGYEFDERCNKLVKDIWDNA